MDNLRDHLLQPYYPGIAKITPELYEKVLARSGGSCEICGSRDRVEVHHVCSRRRAVWVGNLRMLCQGCHKGKESVHQSKKVNDQMMREMQDIYFNLGFNEEEVRFLLGTKSGKLF